MPPATSLPAVIELAFDPVLRLGDVGVRVETVAIAIVLLAALLLAARVGLATPVNVGRPPSAPGATSEDANHLRPDDLLYIAVAALPGAVAGGRLGHVLLHLDYYAANPSAVLDPGVGGLALPLAVLGGILSAAVVAALLGAPVGRWLHAAAVPLLFALAAGKAALVLGGDGQGLPSDLPWATAYVGPGPWGSLAPEVPSHPAQAYEALTTTLALVAVGGLLRGGGFRSVDGRALTVGLGLWAAGRFLVAFVSREAQILGPLRAEHLVSAAVIGLAAAWFAALAARERRVARGGPVAGSPSADDGTPDWPDPATRPRF